MIISPIACSQRLCLALQTTSHPVMLKLFLITPSPIHTPSLSLITHTRPLQDYMILEGRIFYLYTLNIMSGLSHSLVFLDWICRSVQVQATDPAKDKGKAQRVLLAHRCGWRGQHKPQEKHNREIRWILARTVSWLRRYTLEASGKTKLPY